MTASQLLSRIGDLPSVPIAELPTPLHRAARLGEAIGLPNLWIKREDLTGLAFGGNKTRKFALTFAHVLEQGADCVITGAASQSNHARQAAAACAKLGLDCYLVNRYDERAKMGMQGNWLVCSILGAEVRLVREKDLAKAKEQLADELRATGRQPYVIGPHAAMLGAVAYAQCFAEIAGDLEAEGGVPDVVVTASAAGTHAGLALGAHLLGLETKTIAFRPSLQDAKRIANALADLARGAAEHLGLKSTLEPTDFDNREDFVGPDYGVPTPEGMDALHLTARTEGILLDPVYSAKAMAGLGSLVETGEINADANVVFVHTGGNPALFAYGPDLAAAGDYSVRIIDDLAQGIL